MIDRIKLSAELSNKQALYKQMLRDGIKGHVMDKVVNEIAALNLKIHSHGKA